MAAASTCFHFNSNQSSININISTGHGAAPEILQQKTATQVRRQSSPCCRPATTQKKGELNVIYTRKLPFPQTHSSDLAEIDGVAGAVLRVNLHLGLIGHVAGLRLARLVRLGGKESVARSRTLLFLGVWLSPHHHSLFNHRLELRAKINAVEPALPQRLGRRRRLVVPQAVNLVLRALALNHQANRVLKALRRVWDAARQDEDLGVWGV